ncbi:MAG: nucleotidyltransferase [Thermoanaerobaculia bacterium]
MSFSSILHGLEESRIEFVVVGGLAAAAHGSRRLTDDVDICYATTPMNLNSLSALLSTWKAYPRGIEKGLPFFMDEQQFRTTPLMTLVTTQGMIDVLDVVKGVGDYEKCSNRSVEVSAFNTRFKVLDLPALIDAKRAAGRPRDIDHIPELEALLALNRQTRKV